MFAVGTVVTILLPNDATAVKLLGRTGASVASAILGSPEFQVCLLQRRQPDRLRASNPSGRSTGLARHVAANAAAPDSTRPVLPRM